MDQKYSQMMKLEYKNKDLKFIMELKEKVKVNAGKHVNV